MPTAFPTDLDAFTSPGPNSTEDTAGLEHDIQHEQANAAILALEAKVGKNGSAVNTSLDFKAAAAATHAASTSNPHAVTKAQVGLGSADNTSDADKPVSTAQAAAIAAVTSGDTPIGGNLSITPVGKGLRVKEGTNAKQGTATLVAGTVTVSNTSTTATSRILLTSQQDGGTPGWLRISARTAGTSFTILSSSGTDTSVVAYQIFEPA